MKPQILIIAIALFSAGCAASYKQIDPPHLSYLSKNVNKLVTFEYQYSILQPKYAKKEKKFDIRLIAVKITNNTDNDLVFGENAKLYFGNGSEVLMINKDQVYSNLKQKIWYHLFYLWLSGVSLPSNDPRKTGPLIGLLIGPPLAARNILVARSSNSKFKNELNEYYLTRGALLKSKSTVYGLIGVKTRNYEGIVIKVE